MSRSHFPLWFVVPTDKAGATQHDGLAPPVVFKSAEKMAAWLGSRQGENYWYVRLLNREAASELLNELRSGGCNEVYADLDGKAAQKMAMADFVLDLSRK